MSATLVRLRKRAAELEQKKLFDRALEVYVQILDEGGKDLGDEDVPLFNRVGDMLMRKGNVTEALGYYERAVDMYAERGYLNNAIALCSKILRQSPGRAAVYYKLARISAKKGFKSDARKNFLEYADRMQKLGMADEAFRALKEFASLYPDQDDIRLVLAELLSKENRKGEAIEQLQSLYEKLHSEGRAAEARATVDRMRAIDPSVTPRAVTPVMSPSAGDLIFLDLSDSDAPNGRSREVGGPQPSARAPMSTPVPALTGLSITFLPDKNDTAHPEGFEATALEPEPEDVTPVARSVTPEAAELVVEEVPASVTPEDSPVEVEFDLRDEEASDVVEPAAAEPDATPATLEQVTESEIESLRHPTPMSGLEFAGLELEDAPHTLASRTHDLTLPGELPVTPDELAVVPGPSPTSAAAADDARVAAEEAAELAADVAAREAAQQIVNAIPSAPATIPTERVAPAIDEDPVGAKEALFGGEASAANNDSVPDDFLSRPPTFGGDLSRTEEHVFPPIFGLADSGENKRFEPEAEPEDELSVKSALDTGLEAVTPEPFAPTPPRATVSIGSAEAHLRRRLELEPENNNLRRQLGEALLDIGDRDGGLQEFELAMVGFELHGDLDNAQEVVDEILRVVPASVAHHQKRVEYAVRSRDRGRLTQSYLELADALFRTGAGDKAIAVYLRVLELAPDDERAEFALSTLAPEALVKLRGGSLRPERWTDELAVIEGGPTRQAAAEPAADEPPMEVHRPTTPPSSREVAEPAAVPDDAPVDGLELPDPDWGEGVPARPVEWAPELERDEDWIVDDQPQAASSETEVLEPVSGDDVGQRVETPEALRGIDLEVSRETPHESAEERTPASPPRSPTPRGAPITPDVPIYARPDLSSGGSDSDFVDLGEWLRDTEPARSTRMQVEDPKPTGDEQADFDEMLRRFKRGVAENVEAEDYEAHYDLGVAYKEMGLTDEAISQFQKALRGPSNRVRSYEALGQCFVEKQQYPIAAALLQRATEVPGSDDQQLVGVLYLLGFAMEHQGRPADALPYYLRVFAVDIEFRDIAARVASMGNLTK